MCTTGPEAYAQREIFLFFQEKTSMAGIGARRAPAISLPCLSSLIFNLRAAASGFAFTLCNYAATVGVVLSNDPDAHIDYRRGVMRDRARELQDRSYLQEIEGEGSTEDGTLRELAH